MIIQCEQCNVKYRLDESRIPGERAKVKCSRCQHIFLVSNEKPPPSEPMQPSIEEEPKESVQAPFECPQCGFQQPHSEECIKCGIIFSKYKPRSEMPPPLHSLNAGGFELDKNLIDAQADPSPPMLGNQTTEKRILPVFLLCFFFGAFGIHRFYVGKVGSGILQLVTLGGFGIWTLIDFIMIIVGAFTDKEGIKITQWT